MTTFATLQVITARLIHWPAVRQRAFRLAPPSYVGRHLKFPLLRLIQEERRILSVEYNGTTTQISYIPRDSYGNRKKIYIFEDMSNLSEVLHLEHSFIWC